MGLTLGRAVETFGGTASINADGSTYTQIFQIKVTGLSTASPSEKSTIRARALFANGIPQYSNIYAGDANAFCETVVASVLPGLDNQPPEYLIVTCTFSTRPVDKRDEETDPLLKRPDITWSTRFERQVVANARRLRVVNEGQVLHEEDDKGPARPDTGLQNFNEFKLAIINSAGDPFQPQPEQDIPFPFVTITQNVAREVWDPIANAALIGSVNKAALTIDGYPLDPEQGLLLDRTATIKYQGKLSYREVVTTILIKNTHDFIIQDKGLKVLILPSGSDNPSTPDEKNDNFGGEEGAVELVAKVDGDDTPIEVLLDGKGNKLGLGKSPFYLHYATAKKTNFNLLRLPAEKQ